MKKSDTLRQRFKKPRRSANDDVLTCNLFSGNTRQKARSRHTYNTTITNRTNLITMTATLTYTLLLGAIYLLRKIFTLKEQTA